MNTVHDSYTEVSADSYADFGFQIGRLFGRHAVVALDDDQRRGNWEARRAAAQHYMAPTREAFPEAIEEMQGYAEGAGVAFDDLWTLCMEDELRSVEKCTTIIAGEGMLVGHNEDWDADAAEALCLLKKSVGDGTVFELFYYNTLGGNAISINSHGVIQAVNSLTHTDWQIGIPRNVTAWWLSETSSPRNDINRLVGLRRSSGYSHVVVDMNSGESINLELSATQHDIANVTAPFVHANHSLSELRKLDDKEYLRNRSGSVERFAVASEWADTITTTDALKSLLDDTSRGPDWSIFNERTIGRMVINITERVAHVWLLREAEKGWCSYDLNTVLA